MNWLIRIIKNRVLLSFAGVASIALLIWYLGPLLSVGKFSPLVSATNRLAVIAALAFIWIISTIWRFFKARRVNRQLLDSLAEPAPLSATDQASAEESATLNNKMQEAIDTLKQRNFSKSGGSRFIYELPWYAIIGPPGAGKTTLLSNSGLDFPLEESHGKLSVKGIGGTRNCDWWFTDQAVLLDTAGRYTTQDSDTEVDKSAWTTFLKMLKEKRSRRPLNGVLVAISLQDLIESDADTLAQIAKMLRSRIDELYQLLGIAPPIYLMVTKCDLMAGFSEFFADCDRDERRQVWGFTLPVDSGEARESLIESELKMLGDTIYGQTVSRMQRELSQRNRERIYTFPQQFSLVQTRLNTFSRQLTLSSSLLQNILFRGIYFTSATQDGSVIDQVISSVSKNFGVDSSVAPANSDSGKSYFINKLLTGVIFCESGLAGSNLKVERRLKHLQLGGGALITAALVGALGLWTLSYQKNSSALERVATTADMLQEQLDLLPPHSIDIISTDQALTYARQLAYGEDRDRDDEQGLLIRTGLYQGTVVNDAAEQKYRELLIDTLLPRLMVRLEHQMHAQSTNNEFIFEALKTYQMIGNRERFNADSVIGWFNFDMESNLPADINPQIKSSLKRHISTLFEKAPYRLPRPIDAAMIEQYQKIAASLSIEQRAYQRLKAVNQDSLNAYYKISEVGGVDIATAFERADSQYIDQSIPLFFTRVGHSDTFTQASQSISQRLNDDTWVLGEFAPVDTQQQASVSLQSAVTQLYFDEYISLWESLIANVKIKPIDGLDAAAEFISLVSEPGSPLKNLLVVIGEQTLLTVPESESDDDTVEESDVTDREERLNTLLGNQQIPATSELVLDPVSKHFTSLHAFIDQWQDNASQIDQLILELANLNLQLLPMAKNQASSVDPAIASELSISLQKLTTRAGRLPEPLSSLINNVSKEVSDAAGGGFCQQLNAAWQAEVYGYYQRAIQNRYPVNRQGTADIALADFGSFFGRDGIIDQFVNSYLTAHVAKTEGQWTWTNTESAQCLSDNSLKQLAFADDIKNTYFASSAQTPSFQFDIVPNQLVVSSQIEELFLSVGGSSMEFFHGPIKGATSFRWPDTSNNTQVSLRVKPISAGGTSSHSLSGPWAVLRLLDMGTRSADSGRLTVDYSFGSRPVSITLTSSSFNPLNSVALRNFRLAKSL